jgi:hypothetical protein
MKGARGQTSLLFVAIAASWLTACGGGSGDAGSGGPAPAPAPAPSPSPSPFPSPAPPPADTAAACFNPIEHVTGTRITERTRVTSANGATVNAFFVERETLGPRMFEGNDAVAVRRRDTITEGNGIGESYEQILYERFDASRFLMFGSEREQQVNGAVYGFRTNATPFWLGYDAALVPGQSYTHIVTWATVQTTPEPPTPFASTTDTYTATFVGFETVTVPAGTFTDACKWQFDGVQTSNGVSSPYATTYWIARDTGFTVKMVGGGLQLVLEAATRNGVPVTP